MKMKGIFLGKRETNSINRVYNIQVLSELKELVELDDCIVDNTNLCEGKKFLKEAEVAFSTWGMPTFTEDEIRTYMPKLKAVFYAAGSVQYFARPFLSCGVKVISAWAANAIPVAECAAAQVILANKGFYQCLNKTKRDYNVAKKFCESFPGNYSVKVGILGAGMIGTKVIQLLKPYRLQVMVFDPFLSDERAKELEVTKHSLIEIFSTCQTISNHLANNPETVGILNREHFKWMLPNATFINTGRGAQVVEKDLIEALKEVPTRTAVLDVTDPEPPESGSELLNMDNVFLTPHIAGSMNNELERMAEYMLEEFIRFKNGEKLEYEVTLEMLKTMA